MTDYSALVRVYKGLRKGSLIISGASLGLIFSIFAAYRGYKIRDVIQYLKKKEEDYFFRKVEEARRDFYTDINNDGASEYVSPAEREIKILYQVVCIDREARSLHLNQIA
jgi:hypothetical protein